VTLSTLDRYRPDRLSRVGGRAVVLGGSVAGLCAARVLADGFDEVVVLERDPLPDDPAPRDGAPQTSHPHVLLEAGRVTLEDLFPGFGEGVLSSGGLLVDTSTSMEYYDEGGFVADARGRLPTYCATRALFEHVLRRRLADVPDVDLRGGYRFLDYRTDEGATAVTGVRFRSAGGDERSLEADLVVDATGRTSRTPEWLASSGYAAPPVDEVDVDVSYATVRIERPPADRRIFFLPPSPPRTRGVAFVPVEGDRWEVIAQGVHGTDPPGDREALAAFVEDLPVAEPGRLLRSQGWTSDGVDRYPFPTSRRNRYEDLDRFPDGLVVTGDAVASFNPVYGQGMSVAALDAVALHHALVEGGLADLPRRYFERASAVVDVVWQIAVGSDFEFPQTSGPKPRGTDLFNRYVSRLLRRAHDDPVLSEAFLRVLRLEREPTSLLHPGVAWRVVRPSPSLPALLSPGRSVDG
jgi:2-polyprenyl-6-methoxyphenol hydroxylase-like FAD-dependent oxidoreductase